MVLEEQTCGPLMQETNRVIDIGRQRVAKAIAEISDICTGGHCQNCSAHGMCKNPIKK